MSKTKCDSQHEAEVLAYVAMILGLTGQSPDVVEEAKDPRNWRELPFPRAAAEKLEAPND
jgi:hypothetical protein